MKIYSETRLSDFDFWAGAKDNIQFFTSEELELIECILEDFYYNGMSRTELNDLFWFEIDFIVELLGHKDFESFIESR